MSDLLSDGVIGQGCLIRTSFLLESHWSEQENCAHDAEDWVEVVLRHSHDVHAFHGGLILGGIINARNWKTSIWQERVSFHVVEDEAFTLFRRSASEQLIENMECTLLLRLTNGSRFLEQISLDIGTRNVTGSIEIDSNEFALCVRKRWLFTLIIGYESAQNLRISMSCRSLRSWRYRKPRESGSLAATAVPTHPVRINKANFHELSFVTLAYRKPSKQKLCSLRLMQKEFRLTTDSHSDKANGLFRKSSEKVQRFLIGWPSNFTKKEMTNCTQNSCFELPDNSEIERIVCEGNYKQSLLASSERWMNGIVLSVHDLDTLIIVKINQKLRQTADYLRIHFNTLPQVSCLNSEHIFRLERYFVWFRN